MTCSSVNVFRLDQLLVATLDRKKTENVEIFSSLNFVTSLALLTWLTNILINNAKTLILLKMFAVTQPLFY